MIEKAYAKINLILDIVGKRPDGYHELKSLMIPIDFYDELQFEPSAQVELISNVDIPNNAILKTVHLMKETYQIQQGVKITLNKRIPMGAGLAGGSADISATIRGLNRLWGLNLPNRTLVQLANSLGSDTLFCLYNQRAVIYGRGDQISILPKSKPIQNITLICPNLQVLTKDVFSVFEKQASHDFEIVLNTYLVTKNESLLYNDLLASAFKVSPKLKNIYNHLESLGLKPHLSGSGSTCFLLNLTEAQKNLLKNIDDVTIIDTQEHQ